MKIILLTLFVLMIAIPLQSFADEIEKNLEPDVPRGSTPVNTVYMTDKDGNVLSSAKLGEQVFFKLPVINPFVSPKEVDYLFHIFDDGEVIFLKPDTILLEGKTSTDVMISWVTSSTGMLDITLEQFHHNTDTNIAPVLQSTINIWEMILSPLKQFKSGVPVGEIQCKESLIRMVKHDGSPACVTKSTAPKLSDRGWIWALDLELWENNYLLIPPSNYEIQNDDGNYGSQYMISGARVDDISYDENHNSLVILLSSPERGILQIVMPSGLLHSVTSLPFSYVVLANGIEIEFEKLSPIMLKIPFDSGTEQLEIVGFDYRK